MAVNLHLEIGDNVLNFETSAPFVEVEAFLTILVAEWFAAIAQTPSEADHLVISVGTPEEQPL